MKKRVIDVKTLEVWESYGEAARCLGGNSSVHSSFDLFRVESQGKAFGGF